MRRGKSASKRQPAIAVVIEETLWRKDKAALVLLRRAARLALKETAAHEAGAAPVLTVLLGNNERLRDLNRMFRGKNKPTNVLSFPGKDGYLGDIAIALGVTQDEAQAQNKSFAAHAAHLAVHGVLHLLGHDHMKKHEASIMEGLEIRILAELGIANPYAAIPIRGPAKPVR